ncbi:MAG: hypothetical protein ACLS6F_08210, partial [Bifidobacterium breve]
VEAPRGVEPTGTNGRKATQSSNPGWNASILLRTIPHDNEHGMNTRRTNASRPPSGSQAATKPADPSV